MSSPAIAELEQSPALRFEPGAPGTSIEVLYALRKNLKALRVQCVEVHARQQPQVGDDAPRERCARACAIFSTEIENIKQSRAGKR